MHDTRKSRQLLPMPSVPVLRAKLASIEKRDQRLDIRVSTREKEIIMALAGRFEVSVTDLLLTLALETARNAGAETTK